MSYTISFTTKQAISKTTVGEFFDDDIGLTTDELDSLFDYKLTDDGGAWFEIDANEYEDMRQFLIDRGIEFTDTGYIDSNGYSYNQPEYTG